MRICSYAGVFVFYQVHYLFVYDLNIQFRLYFEATIKYNDTSCP